MDVILFAIGFQAHAFLSSLLFIVDIPVWGQRWIYMTRYPFKLSIWKYDRINCIFLTLIIFKISHVSGQNLILLACWILSNQIFSALSKRPNVQRWSRCKTIKRGRGGDMRVYLIPGSCTGNFFATKRVHTKNYGLKIGGPKLW